MLHSKRFYLRFSVWFAKKLALKSLSLQFFSNLTSATLILPSSSAVANLVKFSFIEIWFISSRPILKDLAGSIEFLGSIKMVSKGLVMNLTYLINNFSSSDEDCSVCSWTN
jgi:hypothetical protein